MITDGKEDGDANFKSIFIECLGDDEQDKLIVLDYLIIDYVLEKHSLTSSEMKSAISAYELVDEPELQAQI